MEKNDKERSRKKERGRQQRGKHREENHRKSIKKETSSLFDIICIHMSFFLTIFTGPARDNKAPHLLLQRRLRALPLSRDFFHRGREENTTPLT
jgi:polynucleotide 5'-kinase involved in rRNA processing